MRPPYARLVAVCLLLLIMAGPVVAGGVHIRYAPDAPEKLLASNIRYYEGVLNLEHRHPIEFAHEHPFYKKILDDPAMMSKLIDRWEANEQRFEYWHNCLWKVLDGYRYIHSEQAGELAGPGNSIGPVGVTERNGGSPENGGPGVRVNTASVPEPSSGLLIVLGVLISGSWLVRRGRSTETS